MSYLRRMPIADALAVVLLAAATAAFWVGNSALAHADDVKALYWLIVGAVTVRAAVQILRPGAKA